MILYVLYDSTQQGVIAIQVTQRQGCQHHHLAATVISQLTTQHHLAGTAIQAEQRQHLELGATLAYKNF